MVDNFKRVDDNPGKSIAGHGHSHEDNGHGHKAAEPVKHNLTRLELAN